jgi:O-antigen/teichoic acid export membrane protein
MEDITVQAVKKKSYKGIIALTSRTFALQLIALGATFLLTIFLSPATFGIFYVVSAIINFLTYFSDIGLAAALIQKKEELTEMDLTTTFTIQQVLVVTIVLIALIFSQMISKFYKLDNNGLVLFRVLAISFFISSLKTIPSILLERKLDFQKLVIPTILETLAFYGVAVVMAWQGMGIASFSWAVISRAVVGLIAIYIICPWKIKFGFSKPVAKRLLKFGVPFQVNSLLALVKDDLLTVFLGKVLPFTQIGYIGWAKKWAEVPLRLIMDSVVRVTFPAFSRLQHAGNTLARAIEKTLFGLSLTIFPITIGLIFFVGPLVSMIPKYGKWSPALFSFSLFAISSAVSSLSVPLTNTLNAVGRIKTTLKLMVMWTVASWILTVTMIHFFGFNGVAISLLSISATIFIVVYLVQQVSAFRFWSTIIYPLIACLAQGLWYYLLVGSKPYSIPKLVIVGITGVIIYIGIIWFKEKNQIKGIISNFRL